MAATAATSGNVEGHGTHTQIHTQTHTYTYTDTHPDTYTHTHTSRHIHTYIHTHTHTHTHTSRHIHAYTHTHTHTHTHTLTLTLTLTETIQCRFPSLLSTGKAWPIASWQRSGECNLSAFCPLQCRGKQNWNGETADRLLLHQAFVRPRHSLRCVHSGHMLLCLNVCTHTCLQDI